MISCTSQRLGIMNAIAAAGIVMVPISVLHLASSATTARASDKSCKLDTSLLVQNVSL